jgi:hypothetical protein
LVFFQVEDEGNPHPGYDLLLHGNLMLLFHVLSLCNLIVT